MSEDKERVVEVISNVYSMGNGSRVHISQARGSRGTAELTVKVELDKGCCEEVGGELQVLIVHSGWSAALPQGRPARLSGNAPQQGLPARPPCKAPLQGPPARPLEIHPLQGCLARPFARPHRCPSDLPS